MGFVNWVGVILVLWAIRAGAGLSSVQFYFFGTVFFLTLAYKWRYTLHEWNLFRMFSTRPSGASEIDIDALKLNDSLHQLHEPQGDPGMQILFFHGLQDGKYEDAHLSTWKSGEGKCIWPKTWLVEKYENAHILTVSYNGEVLRRNLGGNCDASRMYVIVENLISDLMQKNIGQRPDCPVILVGHSFGGLVIKQLCVQAFLHLHLLKNFEREKEKLEKFLSNVKGIFYYSTPHHGSPCIDELADSSEHPLLKYFKTLSTETETLNFTFDMLRSSYPIRTHGLGESLPAQTGLFQGVVGVPEPSARVGDSFNVVEADHIQICRPDSKEDRRFYGLTSLIDSVLYDLKDGRILGDTSVHQEERSQAKARICDGATVGEETWALDEAQPQNFLHQPRHFAAPDHVQVWRPGCETAVARTPQEVWLQQEMRHAHFQNPRRVVVADHGYIHRPMQEIPRRLYPAREQLGRTAIDSTTVNVQRPANIRQAISRGPDSLFHKLPNVLSSGTSPNPPLVFPVFKQLNDHVYEVFNPSGRPSVEIVFFHGLQLEGSENVYISTWISRDGSFWLKWIVDAYPGARILLVSYDASVKLTDDPGLTEMYITRENLVQDLIARAGSSGQDGCPVILVGHCMGGLVLKQVCVQASSIVSRCSDKAAESLLNNIKGLFFYGSPHYGSQLADSSTRDSTGLLFQDLNRLNPIASRQNEEFRQLRKKFGWRAYGIGESLPVSMQGFRGLVVGEASGRCDVDSFYTVHDDHFNICRPSSMKSSSFSMLSDFIAYVLKEILDNSRVVVGKDRYSRL